MATKKSSYHPTIRANCTACKWCTYVCPVNDCITFASGKAVINHDTCFACNQCVYVCPVDAVELPGESHCAQAVANQSETYDVVVIGAGMGGLLAACQLAHAGKKVLLVEKLSMLGGRFSAFNVGDAEISSGALHTIPHGNNGPFAKALLRCGVDAEIVNTRVFASFLIDAKHITARRPIDALKIFPTFMAKLAVVFGLLRCWLTKHYDGTFGEWMCDIGLSPSIQTYVDRFFQFALSASVDDIPYSEAWEVIKSIIHYGLPGVPKGGAREISRQLGLAAEQAGVEIRTHTFAKTLVVVKQRVGGITLYDRCRQHTYTVNASTVISSICPGLTHALYHESGLSVLTPGHLPDIPQPAVGIKLQVLSPTSLIDHNSIMFCLDTQRVAGIAQVSNNDAQLAPPGMHLLMSHQTMRQGADWQEESDLALEDWHRIFGEEFDACEIKGISQFPGQFPVNWASQGDDLRNQIYAEQGLWLVGDGVKPKGLMMIEGVAASVHAVVQQILGEENTTPWKTSWISVIVRWLRKWKLRLSI